MAETIDFIDHLDKLVLKQKTMREGRKPKISKISGVPRMLVHNKGWLPFDQITWGDFVKTKCGQWREASLIDELQERD